jgi:L-2-hydroxycarboxylate dehydrogenase (NAD+)
MNITIQDARDLAGRYVLKTGFCKEDCDAIVSNVLHAELSGKASHGLVRLPWLRKLVKEGEISVQETPIGIEGGTILSINGQRRTGYAVMRAALKFSIEQRDQESCIIMGFHNTAPTVGVVGQYASMAAQQGWIFFGMSNTPSTLIPFGLQAPLWGTNPFTIGIPRENGLPIIYDIACSAISWGEVYRRAKEGIPLPLDMAYDGQGNPTTDPKAALQGGLLPFAGHKGSGLAFVIEILAGALTGSKVGGIVPGGWGSLIFLLRPTIFRSAEAFSADLEKCLSELKSHRADSWYPGEHSQHIHTMNMRDGRINVPEQVLQELRLSP